MSVIANEAKRSAAILSITYRTLCAVIPKSFRHIEKTSAPAGECRRFPLYIFRSFCGTRLSDQSETSHNHQQAALRCCKHSSPYNKLKIPAQKHTGMTILDSSFISTILNVWISIIHLFDIDPEF